MLSRWNSSLNTGAVRHCLIPELKVIISRVAGHVSEKFHAATRFTVSRTACSLLSDSDVASALSVYRKYKYSDAKPEVVISHVLSLVQEEFLCIYQCFHGQPVHWRQNLLSSSTYHYTGNTLWLLQNRKWFYFRYHQ